MKRLGSGLHHLLAAVPFAMIVAAASAHHSGAAYDFSQTESASAVIKQFHWGAPHSSMVMILTNADGSTREITLASAAPTTFVNRGFKPKDFQPGDKVEISWHPSRGGTVNGALASMKLADGRVFKEGEFQASPTTAAPAKQTDGSREQPGS